jgi:cytochrome c-type biogenesis protein CcmH
MKFTKYLFFIIICTFAFADTNTEQARFDNLTKQIRCPKCQNQSLAESNAPVAEDLKQQIKDLMKENYTDSQIIDFLTDRYGDFINYSPPFKTTTYILYFAPLVLVLICMLILFLRVKRHNQILLTATEQEQINRILQEQK